MDLSNNEGNIGMENAVILLFGQITTELDEFSSNLFILQKWKTHFLFSENVVRKWSYPSLVKLIKE